MEKIVIAVMWFFIIMGACIVTKICLVFTDTSDVTSLSLGLFIPFVVWFTIGYELRVQLKKLLNK